MVGTPESAVFFEQAMQLARRSVGLRYDVMEYGSEFRTFCEVLYSYQYVKKKTNLTDGIIYWLYEHSSGNVSVVVSLIHDAQEIAILNGTEALNLETLNEAYTKRLSLLHEFIEPSVKKIKTSKSKETASAIVPDTENEPNKDFTISSLVSQAKDSGMDIVDFLKTHFAVIEVRV